MAERMPEGPEERIVKVHPHAIGKNQQTNDLMKTNLMKTTLWLLAAAFLTLAATSCNTMRGVGRDVQKTGQNIERATR